MNIKDGYRCKTDLEMTMAPQGKKTDLDQNSDNEIKLSPD